MGEPFAPCWVFRHEADPRERWELYREMDYEDVHAMCDLDEGHPGPHAFVRQDAVMLGFPGSSDV